MRSEAVTLFWARHPALLYGIALLIGCAAGLSHALLTWFIPLLFLAIPLLADADKGGRTRCLLALFIFSGGWLYTQLNYLHPSLPAGGASGVAEVKIAGITHSEGPFGRRTLCKGHLEVFHSNGGVCARNLPITIPYSDSVAMAPLGTTYRFPAVLKPAEEGNIRLIPLKGAAWEPINLGWGIGNLRYEAKVWIKENIAKRIADPESAAFLAGIATGEMEERNLLHALGRFGLQHLLAVSGFHFTIIAAFFGVMLRIIAPPRLTTPLLMLAMSSYFMFLGPSASIVRAWISVMVALGGRWLQKDGRGLNTLGLGLLVVLLYDPLLLESLGFQFSFAVTAAILLFYAPADDLLQRLFLRRGLYETSRMDPITQHGYIALVFLRQGLAMALAVNIIALPVTLFYFQKFPIMGLFYNLFFPFMVSASIVMLILGFMWPLGTLIDGFNSAYTSFALNMVDRMPAGADIVLRSAPFPSWAAALMVSLAFMGGIFWMDAHERKIQSFREFAYL